jgi:L,D-transpeptidase catalytic domain
MTFRSFDPKHNKTWSRSSSLAIASLASVIVAGQLVGVASGRGERSIASVESRSGGEPIIAIISLRSQHITVYDANGWILKAPVSSGQKGRETPAGIFAIIEKEAEHYSNLYDDAYMPHMQRITWSGIALHGGLLPGYPASHGCVRMPYEFAERLFEATRLGMRVIVAPRDAIPVMIAHPLLFQPNPRAAAAAAVLAAEADEAAGKADRARIVAATASREAARAIVPVRVAENLKRRAEAQLAAAEVGGGSASSDETKQQAADAQAKAVARITEVEAQLAAAQAEAQPKLDAVAPARQAAIAAETASALAAEAARKAAGDLEPASIFISRKTSAFMSGRPLSPSWRSRSPSGMLIVRSARMFSPPWNVPVKSRCDGAWSR